jgi:hypothetical protein
MFFTSNVSSKKDAILCALADAIPSNQSRSRGLRSFFRDQEKKDKTNLSIQIYFE